jgi:hypothetical protein
MDVEALTLLAKMTESDDPKESKLGNAILEDIYITQAYKESDPELARRALELDGKIGGSNRADLQAYRNYQRAVIFHVQGDHLKSEHLLRENCQNKGASAQCVLVPEFAGAIELGPRYQVEAIHTITSVLIENRFESDLVMAVNLAAQKKRFPDNGP